MPTRALLWSFEGRISRKPYWLASLALIVVMAALAGLIAVFTGAEILTGEPAANAGPWLLIVVLWIPSMWILVALGAKRLHDRAKSAWWLLVFYLLPSVLQNTAGFAGGIGFVLALAGLALSLWALVELGFLRGTPGPNRYGPDPLAAA